MSTIGLSPKLVPAVLACIVGFGLILVGHDDTGLAVLLTGVSALGLGYWAPPGAVTPPNTGEGSDALLPNEALAKIDKAR